MNSRRWMALALAMAMGLIGWLLMRAPKPEPAPAAATDLSSSYSCRECHPAVYAEWEKSFHAQAYIDPLVQAPEQTNNFRKVQCLPCHAPAPVMDHGIGKGARVVERVAFRELGVDCISCHRIGEHMAATRDWPDAPCRPRANADLSRPDLCAPCHNQHETVDEWEASSYAAAGVDCLDCHMPPVERTRADGGTRPGRSHVFPGAHDVEYLQTSFEIATEVTQDGEENPVLVVALTNSGAGHNFPSDARHRAVDLIVTLVRPDGVAVPARESRPVGQEPGTARRRFRNPYRNEDLRLINRDRYGRENTQVQAGETVTLEVPFDPGDVRSARIQVIYKLTPLVPDEEGMNLYDREIPL